MLGNGFLEEDMNKEKWHINLDSLKIPLIFILFFYSIAIILHLNTDGYFYLFNFMYIGSSITLAMFLMKALPKKHRHYARRISQLLVGGYMLIYLGLIMHENMQFEGFIIYLIVGMFAGALLHYLIAKIGGTLLFGRAWCGWTCWTAMILDLLPFRKPTHPRVKYLGLLRYIHFSLSIIVVVLIYINYVNNGMNFDENWEINWLLIGNGIYYFLGIGMAYMFKDNRAFCKYVCPITVFMKVGTRFSLIRMSINKAACIDCKQCEKSCPMDVKLLDYMNADKRVSSTECMLCNECALVCPEEAISIGVGIGSKVKS